MDIVAGLRRQDARALERLVDEYGGLIAHWARAEGHEAEDVVQDVLFRVWRSGHRLRPDTSLPSWLKTVTGNAIRNRWRDAGRKPSVPVGLEVHASPAADPADEQCDRIAVQQVLSQLPPREREVLRLLYVSDLPLEEVADRLDASREATKSLAARARRHFRGKVEQLMGTGTAAVLPFVAARAAEASAAAGPGFASAAAAAAAVVMTAGALTLAATGGGTQAPRAPERPEAIRVSYVPARPDTRFVFADPAVPPRTAAGAAATAPAAHDAQTPGPASPVAAADAATRPDNAGPDETPGTKTKGAAGRAHGNEPGAQGQQGSAPQGAGPDGDGPPGRAGDGAPSQSGGNAGPGNGQGNGQRNGQDKGPGNAQGHAPGGGQGKGKAQGQDAGTGPQVAGAWPGP